jgi:hypothetical protein
MQGGVAQGVGWALNEEYVYDKDGRLENPGFLDYRVPSPPDMPMIDTILVEVPNPRIRSARAAAAEVPTVPPWSQPPTRSPTRPASASRSADVAAEIARGARCRQPPPGSRPNEITPLPPCGRGVNRTVQSWSESHGV